MSAPQPPDHDAAYAERLALVRARWDANAEWWDDLSARNATTADREADLARTAAALALRPGDRLLDAGCGAGQFAIAFAAMGYVVSGVDLSPAMIARAYANSAVAGIDVAFTAADLATLPTPEPRFDAIHARMTLQFVPDLPAALATFRRLLRPGGHLYASVPGALSPIYGRIWQRFIDPDFDMAFVTPRDLEQLFAHLGWEILDQWGEFAQSASPDGAGIDATTARTLPRAMQQAAATTWAFVAR
jgi:SAM-dependent methyltransferase